LRVKRAGITTSADYEGSCPGDLYQPSLNYAMQALAAVCTTPEVNFFGTTTGFIVNYTPAREQSLSPSPSSMSLSASQARR
jgi:hypothetical protein